jgi:Xaa-Pro aminopeptidase
MSAIEIPASEFEQRLTRLRRAMEADGFDGVLAYSTAKIQANVRWLSNYHVRFAGWQHVEGTEYVMFGSCACVVPLSGEPLVRSDLPWDSGRITLTSFHPNVGCTTELGAELGRQIHALGLERVAIDNWLLFPAEYYFGLTREAPKTEFVPSRIISEARRIKSPLEIEFHRKAEEIADAAVQAGMAAVKPGADEYEIALIVEDTMRRLGDFETAGSSQAGAGVSTASGLPEPTRGKKVQRGEWYFFDPLPRYNGYCGDIARMRLAGDLEDLDPTLKHYYDVTLMMNRESIKAIRAGVTPKSLNDIADEIARQEGVYEYKFRLLGHAVGIDIHDVPDYYADETPLQAGEVITIEPCLAIPGVAATRIEDMLVVTEDGSDCLSTTPRELVGSG